MELFEKTVKEAKKTEGAVSTRKMFGHGVTKETELSFQRNDKITVDFLLKALKEFTDDLIPENKKKTVLFIDEAQVLNNRKKNLYCI